MRSRRHATPGCRPALRPTAVATHGRNSSRLSIGVLGRVLPRSRATSQRAWGGSARRAWSWRTRADRACNQRSPLAPENKAKPGGVTEVRAPVVYRSGWRPRAFDTDWPVLSLCQIAIGDRQDPSLSWRLKAGGHPPQPDRPVPTVGQDGGLTTGGRQLVVRATREDCSLRESRSRRLNRPGLLGGS